MMMMTIITTAHVTPPPFFSCLFQPTFILPLISFLRSLSVQQYIYLQTAFDLGHELRFSYVHIRKDQGFLTICRCQNKCRHNLIRTLGVDQRPVVRRPISAKPRVKFNLGFFFLCSKAFSWIIFSVIFRASNHQPVDKKY